LRAALTNTFVSITTRVRFFEQPPIALRR
jgi:hypothetical protein